MPSPPRPPMPHTLQGNLWPAFLLLVGIVLAGCRIPAPPPVVESTPEVVTRPLPEREPARERPARELERVVEEESKSTVSVALLDTAGQQAAAGHTDEAVETLERAIRIEPRRGDLWLRLARTQYNSGEYALAEQNARKGLLFLALGSDDARSAWLLIADAREAQGDMEEAERIRNRWGVFRG